MKIRYKNEKEELFFENRTALIKKYGVQAADRIIQRLGDIDAADCILDLPPAARAHPYEPKYEGKFFIDILKHQHSTRLIICAEGEFDLKDYKTIKEVSIHSIKKVHS